MEGEAAELLKKAIHLPKEARAALVESLLESLDTDVDEDAQDVWRAEIHRRLQEIDADAVKLISWQEARERLWARADR